MTIRGRDAVAVGQTSGSPTLVDTGALHAELAEDVGEHRSHRHSKSRRRRNAALVIGGALVLLAAAAVRPVPVAITVGIVGVVWAGMRRSARVIRKRRIALGAFITGVSLWSVILLLEVTNVVVDSPILMNEVHMDWEIRTMQRLVDYNAVYTSFAAGIVSTIALTMFIFGHYGSQKRRIGRRSRHAEPLTASPRANVVDP